MTEDTARKITTTAEPKNMAMEVDAMRTKTTESILQKEPPSAWARRRYYDIIKERPGSLQVVQDVLPVAPRSGQSGQKPSQEQPTTTESTAPDLVAVAEGMDGHAVDPEMKVLSPAISPSSPVLPQ